MAALTFLHTAVLKDVSARLLSPMPVYSDTPVLHVQTLNANTPGAWDAIHALSYHTYAQDLGSIVSATTNLYQQFGKPIWITEIAAGGGASMQANVDLMNAFLPWANSQPWIERYFWNQAVCP